jgi:hypothetical protein
MTVAIVQLGFSYVSFLCSRRMASGWIEFIDRRIVPTNASTGSYDEGWEGLRSFCGAEGLCGSSIPNGAVSIQPRNGVRNELPWVAYQEPTLSRILEPKSQRRAFISSGRCKFLDLSGKAASHF